MTGIGENVGLLKIYIRNNKDAQNRLIRYCPAARLVSSKNQKNILVLYKQVATWSIQFLLKDD